MLESLPMRWLVGTLKRLSTSYPTLIHAITHSDLKIDISFWKEEIAHQCTLVLLGRGISAVHRADKPHIVALQVPSIADQHQSAAVAEAMGGFLESCIQSLSPSTRR